MSFDNYNFWNELNVSKEEFLALKGLSINKDVILQKGGLGNSVVLVNKADYTKRMKELLSDVSKFKEITVEPGKEINLLLQYEGKLMEFLKRLKVLLRLIYINTYIPRALNQVLCTGYLKSINL